MARPWEFVKWSFGPPCARCEWREKHAIHLPVVCGPRKGEPWGHAFVPLDAAAEIGKALAGKDDER